MAAAQETVVLQQRVCLHAQWQTCFSFVFPVIAASAIAASPAATARDGSSFSFSHFPGTIRMWTARRGEKSTAIAVPARTTAQLLASLPDLRPRRTLHSAVSTHSQTKVSFV
jgi:hypothetical protein